MTDVREALAQWMDGHLDNDGLVSAIYREYIMAGAQSLEGFINALMQSNFRVNASSDFDKGWNACLSNTAGFAGVMVEVMKTHVENQNKQEDI